MPNLGAEKDGAEAVREEEVRATALRSVRDHLRQGCPTSWQGHRFDFRRACFGGLDLSGIVVAPGTEVIFDDAVFHGPASFAGADLQTRLSFRRASFAGEVALDSCIVSSACDFQDATFDGATISLDAATVRGRLVFDSCMFFRSRMRGSDMRFEAGSLSLLEADLEEVDLYIHSGALKDPLLLNFGWATLHSGSIAIASANDVTARINFTSFKLLGGLVDMRALDLVGGKLDFGASELRGGRLDLTGAYFGGATVSFGGAGFCGSVVDLSLSRGAKPPVGLPESALGLRR
jgi:uncharacterized protein YjbI with pentapeptide repeats